MSAKITNKIASTSSDKVLDTFIVIILVLLCVVALFPLWFTIVASLSDPALVATGKVVLWPKGFSTVGYREIFRNAQLWRGYGNTLAYTIVGTLFNLAVTLPAAFALSRPSLPYRSFIMIFYMIPMYFSGGMIPTFLAINEMGLLNTFWVMVIPHGISTFNLIICRNYFNSNIPESLFESATLDGASVTQYFFKFVLPLSKPIISVLALYFAIPKWNDYMTGLLYLSDSKRHTLQQVIKAITTTINDNSGDVDFNVDPEELLEADRKAGIMRYSVIIIAALPMYILYPAVQKYLIGGMMVGSVKE